MLSAIRAIRERDPAATSTLEILLTYPGFHALVAHRIAFFLRRHNVPVLPRIIAQISYFFTGIDIHPAAKVGEGFFIDHGAGVVIGETAVIGRNVTLFQGVTLGGTGRERGKRHPTIGDNVTIGAGAKVLGNITIGDNAYIGANAVVLRSVPEGATVVGVPGRIARRAGAKVTGINLDHTNLPDPLAERLEALQYEIDAVEEHLKGHLEEIRTKASVKDGAADIRRETGSNDEIRNQNDEK